MQIPERLGSRAWNLVPLSAFALHQRLIAHHRHDTDRSKSGKSKGSCTGLGQINAAAFNIRPSIRDRNRDGMTILLVGDLTLACSRRPPKGETDAPARARTRQATPHIQWFSLVFANNSVRHEFLAALDDNPPVAILLTLPVAAAGRFRCR